MSIRSFIGSSSVILLSWLGATFIREVPTAPYRKHDQFSTTSPKTSEPAQPELVASAPTPSAE